ncbi:MAG: PAS domain S-box protein [Anaerolineales bacterium]
MNLKNNKETERRDSVFQLMFEKHGAVMLLIDPQSGFILDANQAAVGFYGYSKTKLCHMLISEINTMPPAQVDEEYQKALREERNYFIFPHKLSNGEERIVEVHSSPIELEEKKVLFSIIHDVTGRKRAEAALRESEEKIRSIIEYATNGIVMTDECGNIVEWNPAHSHITGLARSEVIGRPLWDVQFEAMLPERKTPEIIENLKRLFSQMLSTGEIPKTIQEQEVKILRKNGKAHYIHSVIFSIKTALGFRLAGISYDITERKQTEIVKQEALNRLQKITSRVPGVVYEYRLYADGRSQLPFASESLKDLFGVYPEEAMQDASKIFEKIYPDDYESVIASIQKSAKELSPWKQEFRVKFKDEIIYTLYGNSMPQPEEDGSVLWHGFIANITERKKLEQELQAQRDFATQIINTIGQGLTVTNSEGRFKFVNPAYARMFGYETEDLLGKYPQDVTIPEEHEALEEQRNLRKNGKTTSYESRLRRADGSIAQVLITGAPYESDGRFEGTIAVITDLTEQKRIEEELRNTRDKLVILHSELERLYVAEQQLSRIDALTGINNRRSLFEFAERELNVAARYQQTLSVILFDIDHFKDINDMYGHLMGDQVLTHIAQAASAELRTVDMIGRYGGDEFLILLPQTSSQDALPLAERIHASISKIEIGVNQTLIKLSVSIGITQVTFQGTLETASSNPTDTIGNIILRADKALYTAKQTRNKRTVVFNGE